MSEKHSEPVISEGRRCLLKTLAMGGATVALLPEKWVKPVIDKIMVPAHAQTSVINPFTGIYSNNGPNFGYTPSNLLERLAGALIPSANATSISCPQVCVAFQVFDNSAVNVWISGSASSTTINSSSGAIADTGGFTNCVVQSSQLTGYNNVVCQGFFTLPKVSTLPVECSALPA